jgi:Ca2+-binding RTX toxin-like protein
MTALTVWVALLLQPCTMTGTPGDDYLVGTRGNDVICALGGNDVITGAAGRNVIRGGPGNDRIVAREGIDTVLAGPGADTIWSWDANTDRIDGGTGDDRAYTNTFDRVTNVERVS